MTPLRPIAAHVMRCLTATVVLLVGYVFQPVLTALVVSVTADHERWIALHDRTRLALLAGTSVAALATVALLIAWLRRAYRNLTGTPAWWTVWAWLVPVANLVAPPVIVAIVARRSLPPDAQQERDRSTVLVSAWWLSTVVGLLCCDRVWLPLAIGWSDREVWITPYYESIGGPGRGFVVETLIRHQTLDDLPSLALLISAAVLTALVVRRITAAQDG